MGPDIITHIEEGPGGMGPGRRTEFRDVDLEPLGSDDLERVFAAKGAPLASVGAPLAVRAKATIAHRDGASDRVGERVSFSVPVSAPWTLKAVGLVEGGWLPPGTIDRPPPTYLLDRNVLGRLQGEVLDNDFLGFLRRPGISINPLPAVLEGARRREPSIEEMRDELKDFGAFLRQTFPEAIIIEGEGALRGAVGVLSDLRSPLRRDMAFLIDVMPPLERWASSKRSERLATEVEAAAKRHGIRQDSIVFLAIHAALLRPHEKKGAAWGVLKPNERYDEEAAYNVLADLRHLEVLLHLIAIFRDASTPVLVTSDHGLARLWVGLGIHNIRPAGTSVACDFRASRDLLPE